MAERATEKKAPEASKAPAAKKVQPKLAVSTPGDPYEREADRASSAVLAGAKLPPLTPLVSSETSPAQTKAKEEPET
ncbi:MAG TPA: hypothetical protein VK191_05780, partial [Symbiobacteriaceae bacterium]|nr:hypothetical protein [Symbiobacteriaceae bacterium]